MHRPGTPEYKTVCGSGAPGTMVDPITGAQFEIDECTMMSGVCGSQGTCVNTIGSFKCDCRQGTLVILDHYIPELLYHESQSHFQSYENCV